MTPLKVLDLFAGLEGWSRPFREAGHEVFSVDWDVKFDVDLHADIRSLRPYDLPWKPDLVLASPPCETFSVASIGTHWTGGHRAYEPKTEAAKQGLEIVEATWELLLDLNLPAWVVENPRGVLRKLGIFDMPRTIWYCHYGETRAKPTDIWSTLPGLKLRPECHNKRANHAPDCCCSDHEAAPRGAKTGTQGIGNYADRSLIPYELANDVRLAAEALL